MPTLTSLTSYREHLLSGKLTGQRARIMAALFDSAVPLSRQQLSQVTGLPINAVCGRVNELLGRKKDLPKEKQPPLIQVAYEEKHPVSGGTREYLEPIWPQGLAAQKSEGPPVQTAFLSEVLSPIRD